MERLTVDYGEKFRPFRYAMANGSDAEVGYFKNYDAFYSHMLMVQKLGEYEDLEEQGRLFKLPCKVGDTVYCVDDKSITIFTAYNFRIFPLQKFVCSCEGKMVNFEQFGKTAFLSLDRAEAKLKELRGGEND